MADLWHDQKEKRRASAQPLAVRMRPRTLDEFVGQEHFLGEGRMLRRMLAADALTSVLFYGPPGTGKTTLAEVVARATDKAFERGNAASVGVKDVRYVLDNARRRLEDDGRGTIFFLDEIHRFNKAQQDVLLGDVEQGIVTLIGATTENPFFAVNSALVSRSQVFRFEPLDEEAIRRVVRHALADEDRGYGKLDIQLEDDALDHWAKASDGDARRALTALEIAVESQREERAGEPASAGGHSTTGSPIHIDLETAEQSIQQKAVVYDRQGDEHYDAISAFIKSCRGSDPDAAVYWLARMLHAGEDPMFIARRIAILASEDVGNADPRALQVATAAYDIIHRIGMPECRITLAQATTYIACAPKSNASYAAINAAMDDVKNQRTVPVPKHLQQAHPEEKRRLGMGAGYQYAHNTNTGYVEQEYLGVDATYYVPTDRGYEKRIADYLAWIEQQRTGGDDANGEDKNASR
ncbi:MAG: replication-associated recombination protein A [Phycisphaeraceae bacterium]